MTGRRDPATRKARAAASAGKSLRAITIATGTRPPAAASRRRARAGGTAPISATSRAARARSLRERGCTSTMRLPYTLPTRAMLAVVSVLRISLVAVPALSRVEPARTSGPGAGAMITFAVFLVCRRDAFAGPPAPDGLPKRARAGLHDTSTVFAPARRAAARAPCTNGVTPLAETPTTTSPPRTPARTARAPARVSSSAPSRERNTDARPPAMIACTRLGGLEHAEPAAGAGADEDQPPAGAERGDDQVHGGGDLARDAPDRAHRARVLAIHQRRDAAGVETVEARARAVGPLGGEPLVAEAARHGAHGITGCATICACPPS